MEKRIAIIKGDGIGPEIINESLKVLEAIGEKFGHKFHCNEVCAGGASIDKYGTSLVESELQKCRESDAILLGAVGGSKWDVVPAKDRPEQALLSLRKEFDLFANIRPAKLFPSLKESCPLKEKIIGDGLDLVVVRELTGGIYFGTQGTESDGETSRAFDTMEYNEIEIRRIARVAFEMAAKRRRKVHSIHKANVLESSRLWKKAVHELHSAEFPEVELIDMYVDNAAMQLVINPSQFDVIVTGNMFGDILSDEASMLTGSIGMIPSLSKGAGNFGMYEPIHGSAPDIAGKNIANPIAAILSAAWMLEYSFDMQKEAQTIELAVHTVLSEGNRTRDLVQSDENFLHCSQIGDAITEKIKKN